MKGKYRLLVMIAWWVIGAVVLTLLLECRYRGLAATWEFLTGSSGGLLVRTGIVIFCLEIILSCLGLGPITSVSLLAATVWIATYASALKESFRGVPLLPEDLVLTNNVGTLAGFVNPWDVVLHLVGAFLLVGIGAWIDTHFLHWRWWTIKRDRYLWHRIGARVLVITGCIYVITGLTRFIWHHQGVLDEVLPKYDTTFVAWNQKTNYDHVGFLFGFLYNLKKFHLTAPADYSKDEIERIYRHYHAIREASASSELADADYNLLVVLNESFFDIDEVASLYRFEPEQDLTPSWHQIAAQTPAGKMYSIDYGGGTANVEFELLTGLSSHWARVVPHVNLIPKFESLESLASLAQKNGYQTSFFHPYDLGMYKRYIVMPKLGFQELHGESDFAENEREANSGYISDAAAYREIEKLIETRNNKQMIFLITMQNHTPYDTLDQQTPVIQAYNPEGKENLTTEVYLQKLQHSDAALGELSAWLATVDEPTVLMFFGDHAPGVFHELNDSSDPEIFERVRRTPYFIQANFPLQSTDALPLTTPNCLGNTLLNRLGVRKPTLYYLLDDVCRVQPMLTHRFLAHTPLSSDAAVHDYELVVYDLLGGAQYWRQLDQD